nr:MAG TPA: hypothetical protein [Caudoviricetes sp.]
MSYYYTIWIMITEYPILGTPYLSAKFIWVYI